MAKGKLNVEKSKLGILKKASEFVGVKIEDEQTIGNQTSIEVNYRQPVQLFEVGRLFEQLDSQPSKEGK